MSNRLEYTEGFTAFFVPASIRDYPGNTQGVPQGDTQELPRGKAEQSGLDPALEEPVNAGGAGQGG